MFMLTVDWKFVATYCD